MARGHTSSDGKEINDRHPEILNCQISGIPRPKLKDIVNELSADLICVGNWEILAEKLGFNQRSVLDNLIERARVQHTYPGLLMLHEWACRPGSTVFILLWALREAHLEDVAGVLAKKLLNSDYLKYVTPESAEYKASLSIMSEAADYANDSIHYGTSLPGKDFVLGTKAPVWVPDERVTMCTLCLAEFTFIWRRHHCRACGRIICGNCSENKAPLRYMLYKPARVCDECFEKLAREVDERLEKDQKPPTGDSSSMPATPTSTTSVTSSGSPPAASSDTLGLSLSSIKARFQKSNRSARERRNLGVARPSVLKEVHANEEGSDMSGYLWVAKNRTWNRLWFVVKGKVLYTYRASEDMGAIQSMPLLGFEATRLTSWYWGAEPDLTFELRHQNSQPLVFKPRTASTSSGSERNSAADDSSAISPTTPSPHAKSSADTVTLRLIFKTDSSAATTKWLTVLREASLL